MLSARLSRSPLALTAQFCRTALASRVALFPPPNALSSSRSRMSSAADSRLDFSGYSGAEEPSFRLSRAFVDGYRTLPSPFGFNGLGELVYVRTYARTNPDGSKEQWPDTVERVGRKAGKNAAKCACLHWISTGDIVSPICCLLLARYCLLFALLTAFVEPAVRVARW